MAKRVYKLRNTKTGLYFDGVSHKVVGQGYKQFIRYKSIIDYFFDIEDVNYFVTEVIQGGNSEELNDIEILAFEEQSPKPVKSSVKMKTIKERLEAKRILDKLKYPEDDYEYEDF